MSEDNINEAETRKQFIDKALERTGWGPIVHFQENSRYVHGSVEEYPTKSGPADYILFHEGKALACVEGKRVGTAPYGVLQQAKRYARGFPPGDYSLGPFGEYRIPFVYSTNGINIWFQDLRDPLSLSRQVSALHGPNALKGMLTKADSESRQWLLENKIDNGNLWPFQIEAVQAIEKALLDGRRHMLVAMATGTGKTFTIVNLIYRLMRSGLAKHILFLVDRRALAAQAVTTLARFEAEPG